MNLQVVSERSDKEIAANRAREQLSYRLREFSANMLRVLAGGGKPQRLSDEMEGCLRAMIAYEEATGVFPSREVSAALNYDEAWHEQRPWIRKNRNEQDEARWEADGTRDRERAIDEMARAGMRIVASKMLSQLTQLGAAEDQLRDGMDAYAAAMDKYHRARM